MTNILTDIMTKAAAGEYGEDSPLIGKLAGVLQAATVENLADMMAWGPFICGTSGELDTSWGLHEGYFICPAFGADANSTALYVRAEK